MRVLLYLVIILPLVSCGEFRGINPDQKSRYLKSGTVFGSSSLSVSFASSKNFAFPVVEVGDDDLGFAEPSRDSDSGLATRGLSSINENQEDNGLMTGPNQNDDGFSSPSDVGFQSQRPCTMPDGGQGAEYWQRDTGEFSACVPCSLFDSKNAKCLKVYIQPKPPAVKPKQRIQAQARPKNGGAFKKALLFGLGAMALLGAFSGSRSPSSMSGPSPGGFPSASNSTIPDCTGNEGVGELCAMSPLVIDLGETTSSPLLNLSHPEDGVLFSIRGRSNNYKKTWVSWTSNPRYRHLVLPTLRGEVNSVDNMFGDNTLGPDGKTAEHGFAALSKHDGTDFHGRRVMAADGVIDQNDEVFQRLRLWADLNYDGEAQPDEFMTLKEAGITMIDLVYDNHFYERDIYGNEAIYKSVVQFESGKLGKIFDLWYRDVEP